MKKTQAEERRKYLRYYPQSVYAIDLEQKSVEAICHVDINDDPTQFRPSLLGLVIEKSHAGCSIVIIENHDDCIAMVKDRACSVKTGPLHPLKAVVRWRQDLGEDMIKLGIQYTE